MPCRIDTYLQSRYASAVYMLILCTYNDLLFCEKYDILGFLIGLHHPHAVVGTRQSVRAKTKTLTLKTKTPYIKTKTNTPGPETKTGAICFTAHDVFIFFECNVHFTYEFSSQYSVKTCVQ